ncbi:MAG: hypothetical protein U9O98_07175 [Asgard group archaeon]|nr:hypothetical protein [Asgard group archaeon]
MRSEEEKNNPPLTNSSPEEIPESTKDLPFFLSLKQASFNNIIVGSIALTIYFPIEFYYTGQILHSRYYFHVMLTVGCFLLLPLLYLTFFYIKTGNFGCYFLATKKGLTTPKIISSLAQGIAMHAGIFYPWILLSQKYLSDVTPLNYYLPDAQAWVIHLLFYALNVLMFEYYSKAFVQLQFTEATSQVSLYKGKIQIKGGKWLGFILQNLVWLAGHIQEYFWLDDYIGSINAVFFILVSGILTGLTVLETENIFGVAIGHVLLNLLIMISFH